MRPFLPAIYVCFCLFLSGCVVNHSSHIATSADTVTRHHHNEWEKPLGFAQAVQVGNILYVSGIPAAGETMDEQITAVYQRLQKVLAKHGASMQDVVKEVVYTTDMAALKANAATRKGFYSDDHLPASTWLQIEGLYRPQYMIEVEVVVALPVATK